MREQTMPQQRGGVHLDKNDAITIPHFDDNQQKHITLIRKSCTSNSPSGKYFQVKQ